VKDLVFLATSQGLVVLEHKQDSWHEIRRVLTSRRMTSVASGDGKRILNDLSIDFWEGHVHVVVGPNGAGKSTLAFTIMGLSGYRDAEGEVLFEGDPLGDLDVHERARRGITLSLSTSFVAVGCVP